MKKKILFVCLGNICRSPGAEAILKKMAADRGLSEYFEIGSAGTGGWNVGQPADIRMQQHAAKRGYQLTGVARKFDPDKDFDHFDYIFGMDQENISTLQKLSRNSADRAKIVKITDFGNAYGYDSVPDPFYGGDDGFELVLDLLEDACEKLMNKLAGEI